MILKKEILNLENDGLSKTDEMKFSAVLEQYYK